MRKILTGSLLLLLSAMSLKAQKFNKKYPLYYIEDGAGNNSGIYITNDTIFITSSNLSTTIRVQGGRDTIWTSVPLRYLKEDSVGKVVVYYSEWLANWVPLILDTASDAKKNAIKKNPAAIKKNPTKKS